jgi:acetyl esterase/lipase
MFLDVGAGVDHVRALAARHPLDLRRVVIVGHSAGAHLALWAAGRPSLAARSAVRGRDPLPVRAVVALDGPVDIASDVGGEARVCGRPVFAPLMGGTPAEVPDRYRDASPKQMLPLGVRQYLVGSALLRAADAQAYEAAARASGDSVTVTRVATGGHFGVIAPGTAAWTQVRPVIRQAFGLPAH